MATKKVGVKLGQLLLVAAHSWDIRGASKTEPATATLVRFGDQVLLADWAGIRLERVVVGKPIVNGY